MIITNKEAIEILTNLIPAPIRGDGRSTTHLLQTSALMMAIKALDDIEKIKTIIRTPENFLEQDVYRYKMIWEVIANERKTESKEVEERT